jgi:acyl-CoA synthetase (AMP-forming)/AMP-acid ligase II
VIVVDGRPTSWADVKPMHLSPPAAVLASGQADAVAAVKRHVQDRTEMLIISAARADQQLRDDLVADGFHLGPDGSSDGGEPGRIWIATSGSTGRPKRIAHTLASLTTVSTEQPPRVWLCPYSPGTYAWWQLVTLSLSQPGQDLVMVDEDGWDVAVEHGVTAISGTPTFWRQALFRSADTLRRLDLEQITLGGEPVDQAILDRLTDAFPKARISWIYASSEVGAAITVHDARAGFPVQWLDKQLPGRPTLGVEDGELIVSSPHRGADVPVRTRTGDRVTIVDGRVQIVGRAGADEINVGGTKVSASSVREVLQSHPAVQWARVTGRRAPIVGQVVAAEVVADGSIDGPELLRWARLTLPESAVPRHLRMLDEIPIKETGKSDV